jgi:hypothetical protein
MSAVGTAGQEQPWGAVMKLYFIPFAASTYVPVTTKNIEESSGHVIWLVKELGGATEHPFGGELEKVLQAHRVQTAFSEDFVRLKVETRGKIFFVDNKGAVVLHPGGTTYRISQVEMKRIEKEILNFSGVIDMKASKAFLGNALHRGR